MSEEVSLSGSVWPPWIYGFMSSVCAYLEYLLSFTTDWAFFGLLDLPTS